MAKFDPGVTFTDGDTVTAASLNNIVDTLNIYSGLIADQTAIAGTVSTADLLLLADTDQGSSGAANKVTIQKLLNDALTNGTFTDANLSANLTYGTATGNRTVSTNASITTGTINNATLGTTNGTAATFTNGTITTGLIPSLTAGTTTSTAASITNGTVQTITSSTLSSNLTGGTYSGTLNSTNATATNLTSSTATITNLSTTLSGDFSITQGTGTLGTTGVTAGTYGTSTAIPIITVDAKGRITTLSTSAIGSTGKVLQVVKSTTSSVVTCGTTIPWDDTIPQNTEGNEVLSITITPLSATSTIYMKFDASGSASANVVNSATLAIFKDSDSNAIYATQLHFWSAAGYGCKFVASYGDLSGSTTARTYKVRIGSDSPTIYINGTNTGVRRYGGVSVAQFEAWEVEA